MTTTRKSTRRTWTALYANNHITGQREPVNGYVTEDGSWHLSMRRPHGAIEWFLIHYVDDTYDFETTGRYEHDDHEWSSIKFALTEVDDIIDRYERRAG